MSNEKTKKEEKFRTKLSLGQILQLQTEVGWMLQEPELSFVMKYKLSKLKDKVDAIVRNFRKQQVAIFEEFGDCVNEKTKEYKLKGAEKEAEGVAELEKLVEQEEGFNEEYHLTEFEALKTDKFYYIIMKFFN